MSAVIPYRNMPVEPLRPIAKAWSQEANGNAFGIEVNVDAHLADLQRLTVDPQAVLLVLMQGGGPCGYIGMEFFKNPLGNQLAASEKYWYVMPSARGRDSLLLIKEARRLAREVGAAYMLFSASHLASDSHNAVCRLYERLGMKPFETTYLCPLVDQGE